MATQMMQPGPKAAADPQNGIMLSVDSSVVDIIPCHFIHLLLAEDPKASGCGRSHAEP